jgi:hypothetical protein
MKVIEGAFGKRSTDEGPPKASEVLQAALEHVTKLEAEEQKVRIAAVIYVDSVEMSVIGNEQYPDGMYMLLSMAKDSIMIETLGG